MLLDDFVKERKSGSHDDLRSQIVTRREWRTVNDVIDSHPEGDLTLKKRSPIHGSKNRPVFKKGNHFPEYVGGDESDLPRKSTGVDSAANRQAIPQIGRAHV